MYGFLTQSVTLFTPHDVRAIVTDSYQDAVERHVIRPADPSDRQTASRVRVTDFEALYMRRLLAEYASYSAPSDTRQTIARAYCEQIDDRVRDSGESFVYLYAHTDDARQVLYDAVALTSEIDYLELQQTIAEGVRDALDVRVSDPDEGDE